MSIKYKYMCGDHNAHPITFMYICGLLWNIFSHCYYNVCCYYEMEKHSIKSALGNDQYRYKKFRLDGVALCFIL